MTVLLRSLVVWLMLLALPYQGYAAAQMRLCVAPATSAGAAMAMPSGPHDHAAMMAAQAQASHGQLGGHDGGASSHSSMKCSGSACCSAAAPALALEVVEPALPSVSPVIPFYSDFLPAVDLAHPERPPQGRNV